MAKVFTVDTGGTLTTDLLAYWRMNESSGNALDEVASEDLTDVNTVGSNASGKVGGSRVFVASNAEKFTRASDATLDRIGKGSWSYDLWYKTTTIAEDEDDIMSKYTSGSNRQFVLYRFGDDVTFTFYLGDFGTATVSNILTANTWYYINFGYNSATNSVYVSVNNGTESTDTIVGTGSVGSTGQFTVGATLDTGTYYNPIDGEIDEIGFWSKVLSAQEKTDRYNSGNGSTYAEPVTAQIPSSTLLLMGI